MRNVRAVADRVEREIASVCRRGLTWVALWSAVKRTLREAVPFDAAAFAATDPATLLPTAGILDGLPDQYCASILENEISSNDFDKVADLARSPLHVGILGLSTGSRPERSARFRDVLLPMGLARQARIVSVSRRACWAWLDLYRERGRPEFTLLEARMLDRIARRLADPVRVSLLSTARPGASAEQRPGIVLLGREDELVASDPVADRWLAELGHGDGADRVPLALRAVAMNVRLRDDPGSAFGPARVRARTDRGQWVLLHGFRPHGRSELDVAVVIEPAAASEIAELQTPAFGLTPAERRVMDLMLRGLSTKEISAALHVSPYTVRDHLTHVFDKTGARSRAQLFALLAVLRRPERISERDGEPMHLWAHVARGALTRPADARHSKPSGPDSGARLGPAAAHRVRAE